MINFAKTREELLPLLVLAEKYRKTYRFFLFANSLFLLGVLLLGISIPLVFYLLSLLLPTWTLNINSDKLPYLSPQLILLLFWGLFFVFMTVSNKAKAKYVKIEKEILKTFLAKTAPSFKYYESKQINGKDIAESELISPLGLRFNKNKGTNSIYNLTHGLLSGKVGHTKITMGAVKTLSSNPYSYFLYIPLFNYLYLTFTYIRPWLFKRYTFEQVGSTFLGMVAVMEFNKIFKGKTIILPDSMEKRIGYLAKTFQSLNLNNNQLVNLEDTEFENEFVVYSSDQIEARYILSPLLMQRITHLKKKINKPIMLSFKNNKLYVAVHHTYGFLRLEESKNLIGSNALELLYEDVLMAIDIVEDLNLNSKIWKRESIAKPV